ncbi:MAG: TIGR00730 family Rossman fold protein [Rhizobiaceae bacterium]
MSGIKSICVYCGSQPGSNEAYLRAAAQLGASMAAANIGLVYGGGATGLMGTVAQNVLKNGGAVTGIIPQFLVDKEAADASLSQLTHAIITEDMHTRKHEMFQRADAFIALPGGLGTLEEITEIMTWAQIGRHQKPIAFANIEGFWDPLVNILDHMREEGFIHTASKVRPIIESDPDDLLAAIIARGVDGEGDASIIDRM